MSELIVLDDEAVGDTELGASTGVSADRRGEGICHEMAKQNSPGL